MYFIYSNNNIKIQGDISIIPSEYRDYALKQQNNSIKAKNLGWFCPPLVVDIGKSIMYIA